MSTPAAHAEPVGTRHATLPPLEQLPDDPETLKRMIVELVATLQQERRDKDELRQRLDLLVRRLYGPRSERFNPDQRLLFADPAGSAANGPADDPTTPPGPGAAAPQEPAPPSRRRRGQAHGRRLLTENLPRRPLHHELSDAERLCLCGQVRVDIGCDVSEQLDWQPASFFVWRHLIHKYACPHCSAKTGETAAATDPAALQTTETRPALAVPQGPADSAVAVGATVVSAAKPAQPIDKGLPGAGLLAYVIVSKYVDHLPLYRQESIFERQGVFIARSTTCDWMAACAARLRPLYDLMVAAVLQSRWLHTDDTPVKNQGHEPGTTARSRFWIYGGDRDHPYNVFDFTINRKRDGPQTFLADFHGYLHADAFSGYDALYLPQRRAGVPPIIEVACNAHARRKFYDARSSDAVRAHQALAYYGQLYEIERRAKDNRVDDAQRWQLRQDVAVPILDTFHTWLQEQRGQMVPKSPMAEAIGYVLNNWTALVRYTEAGFLSIDNNVAEREMKRIAIGRKNWLFVGSEKGGRTAAVLFSFTSTCHRLGIEPWAYLQDVLTRLPQTPAEHLADLLPARWQAAQKQTAPASKPSGSTTPTAVDSVPRNQLQT